MLLRMGKAGTAEYGKRISACGAGKSTGRCRGIGIKKIKGTANREEIILTG